MNEVALLPSWKQAVQDFLQEYRYGDLVPLDWLEQRFGMPGLAESQRLTADQFRERQFTWLGNLEAFKAELLKEHQRSEEQTSELQSLMRTSYAVFCLKKKKKQHNN